MRCVKQNDGARDGCCVITHSSPRSCIQSQRDCVLQPRVARHELPWVSCIKFCQPQRGCGGVGHREAATLLGLEKLRTTFTQGSSCLPPSLRYGVARATLGFEPESLWDSLVEVVFNFCVKTKSEARFNVHCGAALEMPSPPAIFTLKRRERRAPFALNACDSNAHL